MYIKKEWVESIQGLPIDLQDRIFGEMIRYGFQIESKHKDDVIVQAFVNLIKSDREKDLI